MTAYDIAVIGAGPAGMMAAIQAGRTDKKTLLVEKNSFPGRKILLTGRGRCNITNSARLDTFIEKFGQCGQFLRTAFSAFSNEDLMDFFKSKGLELKIERQGRVFPVTDSAKSVTDVLDECLKRGKVKVRYNARLRDIKVENDGFILDFEGSADSLGAKKVILATGGASYKDTGSTGEGLQIAKKLGHEIKPLKPGLVPLRTKEAWVKDIQGLTLKNIRLRFAAGRRKIVSEVGEILFTHFGVSGPLVLDLSGEIVSLLDGHKEIDLFIDLKPGISNEEMENKLLKEAREHGGKDVKNMLTGMLPSRLAPMVLKLIRLDGHKKVNQMNRCERRSLAEILKALPMTITGSLPLEEAMVTCGGVSKDEINPRTMESKIVPNLYFAGEIIEGAAPSGGYNLQQAFSTGFLAGVCAANA